MDTRVQKSVDLDEMGRRLNIKKMDELKMKIKRDLAPFSGKASMLENIEMAFVDGFFFLGRNMVVMVVIK